MNHFKKLYYITFFFFSITLISAQDISLENEFIKIVVNNTDSKGRFALETTLGNPDLENDNFKDLIYGKPIPWTSYTTFFIDGSAYIFGNEGKKLKRRSSYKFDYLPLKENSVSNNKLISKTQFKKIDFDQTITFYKNPNTNLKDSILVSYKITNNDVVPHFIGSRILLDTKLGPNDGAPLRIGNQAISSELKLNQSELYAYWQAFDSLVSPNIIAQGLLVDSRTSLTLPDHIHLANWGSLVDTPWNSEYQKGRSFIRTGEKDQDTALALIYLPQEIAPNESIVIKTVYGLGGLSLSEGELSLGLSAPKELPTTSKDSFLIVGYLFNSSNFDSYNTIASFKLPEGLEIVQGEQTVSIDVLKSKEQVQIPLLVKVVKQKNGVAEIKLDVVSKTFDSNSISRDIDFIGPSKIIIDTKSTYIFDHTKKHFIVNATLKNPSKFNVKNIKVNLTNSEGIIIKPIDSSKKEIDLLPAFGSIDLQWAINASSLVKSKNLRLTIVSKDTIFSSKRVSLIPNLKSSYLAIDTIFTKDSFTYFSIKLSLSSKLDSYKLIYDTSLVDFFHFIEPSDTLNIFFNKEDNQLDINNNKLNSTEVTLYFKTKSNTDLLFELLSGNKKLDKLIIRPKQ